MTTKITYAADWTEYSTHTPDNGLDNTYSPLDSLWSDSNIDMIALDWYPPLTDWRDGTAHLDAATASGINDITYLQGSIEGGNTYDYYYKSAADRQSQIRTAITDGTYNKPWMFRAKDLRNWWLNAHYTRTGGVEDASPTAFTPQAKPIWLMELGCPAVDKGANSPNLFPDAKSSENGFPPFSNKWQDDEHQRQVLFAYLDYWNPVSGNNPISAVYGDRMLDHNRIHLWAWDARPYPAFPYLTSVWGDADYWTRGHWLNGRLGWYPLSMLISELSEKISVDADMLDLSAVDSLIQGFLIEQNTTPQHALEQLLTLYHIDIMEYNGKIRFLPRKSVTLTDYPSDALVADKNTALPLQATWYNADSELSGLQLAYYNVLNDYQLGVATARAETAQSEQQKDMAVGIVLTPALARAMAGRLLYYLSLRKCFYRFTLPPSSYHLDIGDGMNLLPVDNDTIIDSNMAELPELPFYITAISNGLTRSVEAVSFDDGNAKVINYRHYASETPPNVPAFNPLTLHVINLPYLGRSGELAFSPYFFAQTSPWQGSLAAYKNFPNIGEDLTFSRTVNLAAVMGTTQTDFYSGTTAVMDMGNELWVNLNGGASLQSCAKSQLLNGANLAMLYHPDTSGWELLQFQNAALVDASLNKWHLTAFKRGRFGTEHTLQNFVPAGNAFILLKEGTFNQIAIDADEGFETLTVTAGNANYPVTSSLYKSKTTQLNPVGLRPYTPCHLKVTGGSGSDRTITWKRRGRLNGDTWRTEIPLGEESERYLLRILTSSGVEKRRIETNTATYTYTVSQQTTDFGGSLPSPWKIAVSQYSSAYGWGVERAAEVWG